MSKNKVIFKNLCKLYMVLRDVVIDKVTACIYMQALCDIDIEKINISCNEFIKHGKRFPLPSELIELC